MLVIQLNGTKDWELCAPKAAALGSAGTAESDEQDVDAQGVGMPGVQLATTARAFNDAALARLHDVRAWGSAHQSALDACKQMAQAGATAAAPPAAPLFQAPLTKTVYGTIDLRDEASFACTTFTLHPGDRLYMPRGILHRAKTGAGGSAHLAIGLPHLGVTWGDVVLAGLGEGAESTAWDLTALLTDEDPLLLWRKTSGAYMIRPRIN